MAYLGLAAVIGVGFLSTNMQGWERDKRQAAGREETSKHRAEYHARAARGPYVVNRSALSADEELVHIAIPDRNSGRPIFDTNCLVYLNGRSSSMVCPGAHGYDLTDNVAAP
jgi:hypothetical protein